MLWASPLWKRFIQIATFEKENNDPNKGKRVFGDSDPDEQVGAETYFQKIREFFKKWSEAYGTEPSGKFNEFKTAHDTIFSEPKPQPEAPKPQPEVPKPQPEASKLSQERSDQSRIGNSLQNELPQNVSPSRQQQAQPEPIPAIGSSVQQAPSPHVHKTTAHLAPRPVDQNPQVLQVNPQILPQENPRPAVAIPTNQPELPRTSQPQQRVVSDGQNLRPQELPRTLPTAVQSTLNQVPASPMPSNDRGNLEGARSRSPVPLIPGGGDRPPITPVRREEPNLQGRVAAQSIRESPRPLVSESINVSNKLLNTSGSSQNPNPNQPPAQRTQPGLNERGESPRPLSSLASAPQESRQNVPAQPSSPRFSIHSTSIKRMDEGGVSSSMVRPQPREASQPREGPKIVSLKPQAIKNNQGDFDFPLEASRTELQERLQEPPRALVRRASQPRISKIIGLSGVKCDGEPEEKSMSKDQAILYSANEKMARKRTILPLKDEEMGTLIREVFPSLGRTTNKV